MLLQRARFHRVAGEHLRAPDEAALIEHEPQGEQHALGALFLGVAAGGFRAALELALEVGVGEVIERDRALQAKEPAHLREEKRLDLCLMAQQQVGGPIQPDQRQPLVVELEHLPQRRFVSQPAPGGKLRGGLRHARNHIADRRRCLSAPEAQALELPDQADLAHHRQRHVLDTDRARLEHFQRIRIDRDVDFDCIRQERRARMSIA